MMSTEDTGGYLVPNQSLAYGDPARLRGRVRPPKLQDGSRFVRLKNVPVVTLNVRKFRKGDKVVTEVIDEPKLHRIAHNSNERASRGEYGLLLAGHTTDDGPETKQPPVVGYTSRYQVGEHNGKPAVLADFYLLKNKNPDRILEQYPRRSPEIMGLNDDDAYLDAVAMIRRSPELDLGYISHFRIDRDTTRQLGSVSRYKSGRKIYRFHCSKYCPSGEPSRFGPSEEEPSEEQPMPGVINRNSQAVAKLLEAVKHLVLGEAEEGAAMEDEMGGEPSFGGEPSGEDFLGDVSGEPSEEGGFSPSEPSMEMEEEHGSPSEPSGEFDEPSMEEEEPSRHRHHHAYSARRRPSRHQSEPSESSMASPSEPSEPSGAHMRGHRKPSKHSETERPRKYTADGGKHGATRMDPQFVSKRPPKPNKFQASGGQSGYPGDYDTYVPGSKSRSKSGVSRHSQANADPVMSGGRGGGRRVKVEGATSRMRQEGKDVSRHSTAERRPSRMQRDSDRTQLSRYQAREQELLQRISRLEDQDRKSRYRAREAEMERHVIQLESEGYVLDRAEEVKDLMRCKTDKEVTRYLKKVRSCYTRTAINQPMIPASLFEDPNEAAQEAGGARFGRMSEQDRMAMDTDREGCEIIGSGFARYAHANGDSIKGEGWERGRNAVSQYFDSRKPTRGRRSRDEE